MVRHTALAILISLVACTKKEQPPETPHSPENVTLPEDETNEDSVGEESTGTERTGEDTDTDLPQDTTTGEPPAPPATETREEPLPKFSYELSGKDASGQACSTGRKVFESERAFCLGLQDADLNANCALDERISFFAGRCADYEWNESQLCRLSLLKPTAAVQFDQPAAAADVVSTHKYCIGRGENMNLSALSHTAPLADGRLLGVEGRYFTPAETRRNGDGLSLEWHFSIVGSTGDILMDESLSNAFWTLRTGSLKDNSNKYQLACERVPVCR